MMPLESNISKPMLRSDRTDQAPKMSKRRLIADIVSTKGPSCHVPMHRATLIYIALIFWVTNTHCFSPVLFSMRPHYSIMHRGLESSNLDMDEAAVEETLSDVDTRVLRALLQEKKLNLDTEEDVRKLLERGTVKTVPKKPVPEVDESEFSSTILKTLTNTKLWQKISAQAEMTLESVSLWVSNKIEQDVKVIAALGLFAWDRVTRDVARALPAASSAAQNQLFLLANRSSYIAAVIDMQNGTATVVRDFREELNRPQDEIQSVTRELFAILSGERTRYTPSSQRGLRSLAPAGTASSAERQRRALQRKQEAVAKRKNIAQYPGRVVDTAWELRRELKAESNVPGYKTEPIRSAIAAGVTATGNLLNGVRERARLSAVEQKELFLKSQPQVLDDVSSAAVERDPTKPTIQEVNLVSETQMENQNLATERFLVDIRVERRRIVKQLSACIDRPDTTWLTREVVESLENLDFISSPAMQDCFTKMILLRDEIDNPVHDVSILDDSVQDLIALRTAIDYLCTYTASEVSDLIAEEIRLELFGRDYESLILRLKEEVEFLQNSLAGEGAPSVVAAPAEVFDVIPDAVFIDVIPDAFMMDVHERMEGMEDGVDAGLMAEIVSDDDFESAVSDAKKVFEVAVDDTKKEEPNLFFILILRSLDVLFFVTEKAVTVVVPGSIVVVRTAWARLDEMNSSGMGSEGWKKLGNIADAKGRY
jgi:hypothetical protein